MANIQTGGKGGMIGNVISVVGMAFKLWGVLCITFIIIILTCVGGLKTSIEQRSVLPFIKDVGGKILTFDTNLLKESINIKNSGGLLVDSEGKGNTIIDKLKLYLAIGKSLGVVLFNIWYIWVFLFIFYHLGCLIFTQNTSSKTQNILLSVAGITILMLLAHTVKYGLGDKMIIDNVEYENNYYPWKGVVEFVKSTPYVFNPIYKKTGIIQPDNQLSITIT